MNNYLLTLILNPDLEEKDRGEVLTTIKKVLEADDGKVLKEDLWGNRELSFPIKKKTKGYYVHLQFSGEPKTARDLDKNLKLEEDILRFLLVRDEVRKGSSKSKKINKKEEEKKVKLEQKD